jgi:phosphoglycerol transferase MdoB-like AlkP superfamily enzyme
MLSLLEMNCSTKIAKCHTHGWLDSLAISMSVICAVHCLLTPLLIALLPIISTTFWVHENFHLWMVFLVVPTTSLAVFMGCRKHKDKLVAALSITGLAFILFIAVYQYIFHAGHPLDANGICTSCTHHGSGSFLNLTTILNSVGGLFLACAHFRNFKLCRKADCNHS